MPSEAPYPVNAPDDEPLYATRFNSAWLPIITGALYAYAYAGYYDEAPPDVKPDFDELIELLQTEYIPPLPQVYANNQSLPYHGFKDVSGGALATVIDTAQILNGYWAQSPAAQFSASQADFLLAAGHYTFKAVGLKASGGGIMTVYQNGTSIGTFDWYNSTTQRNIEAAIDFTVPVTGKVTITIEATGKNASSGGYNIRLSLITIVPN